MTDMNFEVGRRDLTQVRFRELLAAPLAIDEVRIRIDAFALTSNNITYGVFGDAMKYWDFFPAGADATTWGRVPVWGFGDVVESRSADCAAGERLYGYFPMASELVIEAGRADERGVTDIRAHRVPMAGAYNRYGRCIEDPIYRPDRERHHMLLYPLFFTSFVVEDLLADNEDFGASQIVVSSASSKTAIGVAYLAQARGASVIGLTSAANTGFVESLGIYQQVIGYEEIRDLGSQPAVYVDVAGNQDIRRSVHEHFQTELTYSMSVGGTHWDHEAAQTHDELPGPAPRFFFAPTQMTKRRQDWGQGELDERVGAAWTRYSEWIDTWLEFRTARGINAVRARLLRSARWPRRPPSRIHLLAQGRTRPWLTTVDEVNDGRAARRDRNRLAVLDAMIEMFSEGSLDPTPENIAPRVGISPRSVYRYFEDRESLVRAAIDRHLETVLHLYRIPEIGTGDLEIRIERFVDRRVRLHVAIERDRAGGARPSRDRRDPARAARGDPPGAQGADRKTLCARTRRPSSRNSAGSYLRDRRALRVGGARSLPDTPRVLGPRDPGTSHRPAPRTVDRLIDERTK